VIGAIESSYARNQGKLIGFSEQQLLDCSSSYGNMGCNGGLLMPTFMYIMDFGISKEVDYPYIAVE